VCWGVTINACAFPVAAGPPSPMSQHTQQVAWHVSAAIALSSIHVPHAINTWSLAVKLSPLLLHATIISMCLQYDGSPARRNSLSWQLSWQPKEQLYKMIK
jgi:hypothetical protein